MAKPSALWPLAHKSSLVLDGSVVKIRLEAERAATRTPVHVDWVRFTVFRRNNLAPSLDKLFPVNVALPLEFTADEYQAYQQGVIERSAVRNMPLDGEVDFYASCEAYELAGNVAAALGSDFKVAAEIKKGIDFYKFRWSLELNGAECGWVGFLASSESPKQTVQGETMHVNIYGAACTFAVEGWNLRLASMVDDLHGVLTRADLALDFFDGVSGGIELIADDYKAGLCNVGGRKLKSNVAGDWLNGANRSLYFGSRESGKITNVYEKGDQLYGEKMNSEWLRLELRYGNQVRVLPSDVLRFPADYFAGASEWHQSMLLKADAMFSAEKIARKPRLEIETVKAECVRNFKWLVETAGASIRLAIEHLSVEEVWSAIGNAVLPGRLKKFSAVQISGAMAPAASMVSAFMLELVPGTTATYSISTVEGSPAFA